MLICGSAWYNAQMDNYTVLISTEELAQQLDNPNCVLIDCRFKLDDPAAGRQAYLDSHIPGALYAHLDEDLSGPIVPGVTGRHPLPTAGDFAETLSLWGIDGDSQVIAYDNFSGVYAGRLWWMLRWMGHDKVAVLNGDFRHWLQEDRPTAGGEEARDESIFIPNVQPQMQVDADALLANIETQQHRVFDVRDEGRYRGEPSPMDPVSGHIPGAHSAFFGGNLDEDGRFLSPEALRTRFDALLDETPVEETIFYCGSGVSLHHNLLALEHAGLGRGARVYIGSWSDWITDESRPVNSGDAP